MEKKFENEQAAMRFTQKDGALEVEIQDAEDESRQLYTLNKADAIGLWLFLDQVIDRLSYNQATPEHETQHS